VALSCGPVSDSCWLARGRARVHQGCAIRFAREAYFGWLSVRRGPPGGPAMVIDALDRVSVQSELADDCGRQVSPGGMRSPRVAVPLDDFWRASSWETNAAAGDESAAADDPSELLGLVHKNAPIGVQSNRAGPAARILSPSPNATDGANCATRRAAGVTGFDCAAGAVLLRASPHRPGERVSIRLQAGVLALFLARDPDRGTRRPEDDEANGTQFGSAWARRVDPRSWVAAALTGDRCPTAPERPPRGWPKGQTTPTRSERPPLRVPGALARLGEPPASNWTT
jgi:hypothetical protein